MDGRDGQGVVCGIDLGGTSVGDPAGAIGSMVLAYRSLGITVPDLKLEDSLVSATSA